MPAQRRSVIIAYLLSGVIHTGLVAGMLWLTVDSAWPPEAASVQTAIRSTTPADTAAATAVAVDEADAADVEPLPATRDALAKADAGDSNIADLARSQLQQARSQAEDKSVNEKLADLEALGERLNRISSEQSLAEVAAAVVPWIGGNSSRETVPKFGANDDEAFDVSTAQISDVLKQDGDGPVQYVAVMVDAAGRSMETPLDPADGEQLHATFQLMKKFPLLETVYRKSVMGLLDRLMEEESATAKSTSRSADAEQTGGNDQARQEDGGRAP